MFGETLYPLRMLKILPGPDPFLEDVSSDIRLVHHGGIPDDRRASIHLKHRVGEMHAQKQEHLARVVTGSCTID